jgi:hypothetical protein
MTKSRSDIDRGAPASGAPPGGDAPAKPGRARDARLAAALRANLGRRKVQARARKDPSQGAHTGYGDKPAAEGQAGEGSHDSAGFVADKQGS